MYLVSAKDNQPPDITLQPTKYTMHVDCGLPKSNRGQDKDNFESTRKGEARTVHLSTKQMCIRMVIKTRRDRNKDKVNKDNHNNNNNA